MADQMEERTRAKGDELRDRVEKTAEEQKSRAADTADAVAAAIRAAGDSLRDRHEDRLGQFTYELATQVDRFSGYIRDNDMRGLMTNLEETARRNPTSFLGSTLAAGLVAGRFLRSTAEEASPAGHREQDERDDRHGRTDYRTEPATQHRPPSHQEYGTADRASTGSEGDSTYTLGGGPS